MESYSSETGMNSLIESYSSGKGINSLIESYSIQIYSSGTDEALPLTPVTYIIFYNLFPFYQDLSIWHT